jgi:hypothetical protein
MPELEKATAFFNCNFFQNALGYSWRCNLPQEMNVLVLHTININREVFGQTLKEAYLEY